MTPDLFSTRDPFNLTAHLLKRNQVLKEQFPESIPEILEQEARFEQYKIKYQTNDPMGYLSGLKR